MGRSPRGRVLLVTIAAATVAIVGVGAALAQSDDAAASGSSPDALLERLDALEPDLPNRVPPIGVELAEDETWGTLQGDATSVRAVLDLLEPELRQLFVDADDADGDVADGVALVARGWLDIWTGTTAIAVAEAADLAFPLDTRDDDGVATGADELRGQIETGLDLLLLGQARHLEGYGLLEELGEAPLEAQLRFDARARDAQAFDEEVRPRVLTMLSRPTASVLVTTDRFQTDAPGVRARANSMTVVCVDREALEALGGVATEEVLAQLDDVDRVDCDDLPGSRAD
ncbi:MAG: hypothetical protein ACNA8R_12695 [Nitriliruptoraceae bacterium]